MLVETFVSERPVEALGKDVPAELDVHLVLENYITHKTKRTRAWLARHPRFHVHFMPPYSPRINQVERYFALLTERCVKRVIHRSTRALEKATRNLQKVNNDDPKPFV